MTFLSAAVRLEGGKEIVLHEEDLEGESPSPCQGVWEMGGGGTARAGGSLEVKGKKSRTEGAKEARIPAQPRRGHCCFHGGSTQASLLGQERRNQAESRTW